MADIKNKNELKRRIELFMDDLDYSSNKEYCMETMRMSREFIGHVSHRLDCANSKIKSLMAKLREYQKVEEQGLLLRLPCKVGDTLYALSFTHDVPKYYECELEQYIVHSGVVEMNVLIKFDHVRSRIETGAIGKTVFLSEEEAKKAVKQYCKIKNQEEA